MTVGEIRDEIVLEVGGDSSDTALKTKILQFMKSALRRFPRHVRERAFLDKFTPVTLAVNTSTLSIPSSLVKETAVYYESDGSRIEIVPTLFFNEIYNGNASGPPQYYRIYGRTAEFNRKADKNYSIIFEGFKEIDSVSANDTWGHTSDIAEILKDGAKFYYFKYIEDSPNASDFLALFKSGLDQMEADYTSQETGKYIIDSSY